MKGRKALDVVRDRWGDAAPAWVLALARACDEPGTTQQMVAGRLRRSKAAISRILNNSYGDTAAMERIVREVLMPGVVACPVLGEITFSRCHEEQGRSFAATNALRVKLYRACREGCPNAKALFPGSKVQQQGGGYDGT